MSTLVQELPLISTVAMGMSFAFVGGLAAAKLRISPIVGYLLAGILIGPHTPGLKGDLEIANELSEIGIVLLMFGVGLHFSLKDLMQVRKIAFTGAILRMILVTLMGAALAFYAWEWSDKASLMFGLALSVSSTVVLLRSLEGQNSLQSIDGRISIGWLIVEDLIMILVLVFIPAFAEIGEKGMDNRALMEQAGLTIGKVGLFVAIMLIVGKRFLPWLLSMVARTGSRELFTLAVFAVAIGVSFSASLLFGISLALSAFFAGMMIKESDLSHEVADRALPFQDAFAVLFFVAIGMLFDPDVLLQHPLEILAVSGIVIVGKFFITLLIVLFFRYTLRTGLKVAAGLSQIGEFSFILVTMALSHHLLPPDGKNYILAGAILSIALNPLVFAVAKSLFRLAVVFPQSFRLFHMYDNDLAHLTSHEKQELKDLVVLVGHGRVGSHISENIQAKHINLVVIDENRERIEGLRKKGFHALAGDATHEETLLEAEIHKAVAIVVAVPDPFEARRIVEIARALNPGIKMLVRAHNEEEMAFFADKVDLAISGPREIGRGMAEYLNAIRRPT